MTKKVSLLLTSSLLLTMNLSAQQIDSTFNSNGYLPYLGPNSNSEGNLGTANAVAVQPDGKTVVVMTGDINNTSDLWMYTYRYLPDGMADPSFGDNGVSKNFCGQTSMGYDVEIQSDEKIVLIGESKYCTNGICGASQFVMMRLKTNGELDSTFGNNGHILTSDVFGNTGLYSIPKSLEILPNGQFMVGGRGPSGKPAVVRLNSDGFPDMTYGTNGVYSFTDLDNSTFVDMTVNSDGSCNALILRYTWDQSTQSYDSTNYSENVVIRLTANGVLDPTFGTNGIVIFSTDNTDKPLSIISTSTGKLLVAGQNQPENTYYSTLPFDGYGQNNKGFVAFLTANGALDLSVPNGFSSFDILADSATIFNKIIERNPDEFLICGFTIDYVDGNFRNKGLIISMNNSGELNSSFNGNGYMIFDHGMSASTGWTGKIANFNDIDLLDNNQILLSGGRNPVAGATKNSIYMLRLNYGPVSGLGLADLSNESDFLVYPNPATNGHLIVDSKENASLQIIALDGRVLYRNEITNGISEITLNCDYRGIGIVTLQTKEGEISTKKIIFE